MATDVSTLGPDETPTVPSVPPRVQVDCQGLTHVGKVRAQNEDHFLIARLAKSMRICQTSLPAADSTQFSAEEGHLMIVADGMGGAAGGETASALAVKTVENFVLDTLKWFLHLGGFEENTLTDELRRALERADRNVMRQAAEDLNLTGMGTTLTMTFSVATDLYIVHAGDSRAYLFRAGELDQVTIDHTLVQLLVEGGTLTPEAARSHRRRHVVTNVVGGPRHGVHAEIHKVSLQDGDILVLCSDGLTEPVDDSTIAATLTSHPEPDRACRRLLDLALEHGGPDNITVVVARYSIDFPSPAGSWPLLGSGSRQE